MSFSSRAEKRERHFSPWHRFAIIGGAFGIAFACVVIVAPRLLLQYKTQARSWNGDATKATPVCYDYAEDGKLFYIDFEYDVTNLTPADYAMNRSDWVVMAKAARVSEHENPAEGTGDDASLARFYAHDLTSELAVDTPPFIPSHETGRIAVHVTFSCLPTFACDPAKSKSIRALKDARLAENQGFVLFDQTNSYRIDLPTSSKLKLKPFAQCTNGGSVTPAKETDITPASHL